MRSAATGLLILALFGCASGGTGGGERTVAVYLTEDDVPCEYEVMRTVEETCTEIRPTRMGISLECQRERVLGEAGAGMGADAVIVAEDEFPKLLPTVVEGQPVHRKFEGQAVRYLDPTCGAKS
jgi:hypothetical protein